MESEQGFSRLSRRSFLAMQLPRWRSHLDLVVEVVRRPLVVAMSLRWSMWSATPEERAVWRKSCL